MILGRFEVRGLAHYSYLLASEGQAVAIDPKRDIDTYIRYAFEENPTITHVLETHIHADYVSGATALSQATGAQLWLSGHDQEQDYRYNFDHDAFRDGDELVIGDLRIVAIHTPGHTPEHLSFLVFEQSRCGQPLALFSGDFIFVGSLVVQTCLAKQRNRALHGRFTGVCTIRSRICRMEWRFIPHTGPGLCAAPECLSGHSPPWDTSGSATFSFLITRKIVSSTVFSAAFLSFPTTIDA
ncbi:MAG: MBL fold metallo-hydrolase [Bryobacteraceae bacterium]